MLYESERDVVVAFISSKLPSSPSRAEIVIDESHPEFELSGLKVPSVVRLDKVVTVLKDLVVGELGL